MEITTRTVITQHLIAVVRTHTPVRQDPKTRKRVCCVSCAVDKMAAIRHKGRLLLRLRRVIESWPEDSSRSGRDLGGHLKEVLLQKYESRAVEVRPDRREQCS